MNFIKIIFLACTQIIRTNVDLFGFNVSVSQVIVFVFIGCLLIKFIRSFF